LISEDLTGRRDTMPLESTPTHKVLASKTGPHTALNRRRRLKDSLARYVVATGGIAVILAVLLIIADLGWVVLPLLKPASIEHTADTTPLQAVDGLVLGIDEQVEVALSVTRDGKARFFSTASGQILSVMDLVAETDPGMTVTAVKHDSMGHGMLSLGFSDGRMLIVKQDYQARNDAADKRHIEPGVAFPF